MTSPSAAAAFDISRVPKSIAALFPEHALKQSCLLGMPLVEAGERFVSIDHGGWDTHDNSSQQLRAKLLSELGGGLSRLWTALDLKGLLASTSVFLTGEFGRTPRINPQPLGRDHYPRAMFVLSAGGGMKAGQVIGASDAKGEAPADGVGMSPDDVAASFYHSPGIDAAKDYRTPSGRPLAIVRSGTVIRELFS